MANKIKSIARKVGKGLVYAVGVPIVLNLATGLPLLARVAFSDVARTPSEIKKMVDEERTKLGIKEPVNVETNSDNRSWLVPACVNPCYDPNDTLEWSVEFNGDVNRALLRHELAHIPRVKKYLDAEANASIVVGAVLDYFLVDEPRANFYSVTGIYLGGKDE